MTDTTAAPLPPIPALPRPDGTLYATNGTTRGNSFLAPKVRAFAEGYGTLCAQLERARADQRIAALRAGNTSLLEALMDMVGQYVAISDDPDAVFNHSHMACEEGAMRVLIAAGVAEEVDNGYRLLWAALAARKPKVLSAAPAPEDVGAPTP